MPSMYKLRIIDECVLHGFILLVAHKFTSLGTLAMCNQHGRIVGCENSSFSLLPGACAALTSPQKTKQHCPQIERSKKLILT